MTMPIERTLSVLHTRKYLQDRLAYPVLPDRERLVVAGLLRHFPTAADLRRAAMGDDVFDYDEKNPIHGGGLKSAVQAVSIEESTK